jgi:cephalosporin hydroxylase
VALEFQDGYFDWVYIDGDHSYEAVLNDLKAWYPKVKPGGYLALDDLDWTDESGERSVEAAVATFVASHDSRMAKPMQGQFLIQKA